MPPEAPAPTPLPAEAPPEHLTIRRLRERLGNAVLESHSHLGDDTAIIAKDRLLEVLQFLRDTPELAYEMLVDITAVDYLMWRSKQRERFEVVYHLHSLTHGHRVRLKVPVSAGQPEVDSAAGLWKTADWLEREAWDMYGIRFRGHTNLKRLLNHMEFVGHPLRKDYPLKKRQPIAANDPLWDEMDKRLRQKGLK